MVKFPGDSNRDYFESKHNESSPSRTDNFTDPNDTKADSKKTMAVMKADRIQVSAKGNVA